MGLGRADIDGMSLWEYEARLWNWNDAEGGGDNIAPPDRKLTQRLIDKINSDPALHA
jgi:hypothetical protein